MDSKQLRIGNWVIGDKNWDGNEVEFQVNIIHDCDYGTLVKPIKLSEEWLSKFGFEKVRFSIPEKFTNNKLSIKLDHRGFWVIACYNFVLIEHVHQLQNLYFTLTGTELELVRAGEKV